MREGVREKELTLPVVERRIDVRMPRELRRRILEQRRRSGRRIAGRTRRGTRRGDLVRPVGPDTRDRRSATVAPVDDERGAIRGAHRERRFVVTVRQIEASGDHLALLHRDRAAEQPNLRAHGLRVGRIADEPHRDAGGPRVVPQNQRG